MSRPPSRPSESESSWEIDFLAGRPADPADAEAVEQRLAENVLTSYSKAVDFLAEALQNATDAIDTRTVRDPDSPRRLLITFDRAQGRFSVADTGTGMTREELDIVLTPNVTLKEGRLARSGTRRSRGHKGVGLSFLALGSNYLHIDTSDGARRYEVTVRDGSRWVRGEEGATRKPVGYATPNKPRTVLGSRRYTIVTVGDIDSRDYEQDLFERDAESLIWLLRTQTAVGNTAPLFRERFGSADPTDDIDIELLYIGPGGQKSSPKKVPFMYASPEELVPSSAIVPFEEIASAPPGELRRLLKGKGVRYRNHWVSRSGHPVAIYVFAIDGRQMETFADERVKHREFFPDDDWQGFYVATRDMPTGISFPPKHVQPRTYERRIFALFLDNHLTLDLGRKSLAPRQVGMFREAVRDIWKQDLVSIVSRLGIHDDALALDGSDFLGRVKEAQRELDLKGNVPYLKRPRAWAGVMAIFHELVGRRDGRLPELRTLKTGVFTSERDAIIYEGSPNGVPPRHVLFGFGIGDILDDIEREGGPGRTAGLAVVWSLDEQQLAARGVEAIHVGGADFGATHELLLHGLHGLDTLPVIAISALLGQEE